MTIKALLVNVTALGMVLFPRTCKTNVILKIACSSEDLLITFKRLHKAFMDEN
jgi:hypothetical protein